MQVTVQSTISMCSMLMLGGLGVCPQEMFGEQITEIEIEGISGS